MGARHGAWMTVTTTTDIALIEHAAAIIDGEALALRMCSTIPPNHNDWTGEEESKQYHDDMKNTVASLYAMADRMRGKA